MKYLLFHKNIKVLSVNYLADSNEFRDIIEIYNENHLPVGMKISQIRQSQTDSNGIGGREN